MTVGYLKKKFITLDKLLAMFIKHKICIVLVILLITLISGKGAPSPEAPKNVLILHSYNSGLSWTNNINKGIFDSFKNENYRTVDLRVEYLDAKHFEDPKGLKEFLKQKYKGVNIDVIISADNPAFDFLSLYHTEIFKQAPIVFCGLNYCDSIPKGFTGVMEDVDIENNIKSILKLHPNYKKLYIVNDNSITGRSINKELSKVILNKIPNLKYEILTNYTFDELKSKLNSLDNDDVLLMILFNFDRLGRAISYDIVLEEIMPYCKVPMYGMWDFYLGRGIVGGILSGGYDHGLKASYMAKEILSGKKIGAIPIISGSTTPFYDYNVLALYGIDMDILPENSIIINKPFEFIRKNQLFFSLLTVIFTLLIVIILILVYFYRHAKRTLEFERTSADIIKKKSEELNIAFERVEHANNLKTSFLCNLSHEIRTPMNAILGFTSIMQNDEEARNQVEYIDIINVSAVNLLSVINDIVEISQIESHLVPIEEFEVSINDILRDCVAEFRADAEKKGILISLRFLLSNQKAVIKSDSNKISKVIRKLLSNAIKFSDGGTITLGYIKEESQFIFYCRDEGIGIVPKDIECIFEPFRKAEVFNHEVYGGNGLGLAISKAHIELLGGRMWVKSNPHVGSTFYFSLPIHHLN